MIHLFNRVYLDLDIYLDAYESRVVASKEFGDDWDENDHQGVPPMYTTLDAKAYVETAFEGDLLKVLNKTEKFIFVLDEDGLLRALSRWIKTVYPNIDEATFVDVVGTYIRRYNTGKEGKVIKSITTRNDIVKFYVETTPLTEIANTLKTNWYKLSLEHQVVNFLREGSYFDIRKTVSNLVRRFFRDTIYEIRRDLMIYLYSPKQQEVLGYDANTVPFGVGLSETDTGLKTLHTNKYSERDAIVDSLITDNLNDVKDDILLIGSGNTGLLENETGLLSDLLPLVKKDPSNLTEQDVSTYVDLIINTEPANVPFSSPDSEIINLSLVYYFGTKNKIDLPATLKCKK